ncbi:MAG: helix-turn-helix domain-containing protein [Dehalococcoidia bacterium]
MAKISDYLTIGEAAAYLGVHPDSLRRWDRANRLKSRRHPINNFRLYLKRDLDSFLAQIASGETASDRRSGAKRKSVRQKKKRL